MEDRAVREAGLSDDMSLSALRLFKDQKYIYRGSPLEIVWQRLAMQAALKQGALIEKEDAEAFTAMLKPPEPSPPARPIADVSKDFREFRTPLDPSEAAAASGVSAEAATAPEQKRLRAAASDASVSDAPTLRMGVAEPDSDQARPEAVAALTVPHRAGGTPGDARAERPDAVGSLASRPDIVGADQEPQPLPGGQPRTLGPYLDSLNPAALGGLASRPNVVNRGVDYMLNCKNTVRCVWPGEAEAPALPVPCEAATPTPERQQVEPDASRGEAATPTTGRQQVDQERLEKGRLEREREWMQPGNLQRWEWEKGERERKARIRIWRSAWRKSASCTRSACWSAF